VCAANIDWGGSRNRNVNARSDPDDADGGGGWTTEFQRHLRLLMRDGSKEREMGDVGPEKFGN